MQITELAISGAYKIRPVLHTDQRGTFSEMFRQDIFEDIIGRPFDLKQSNLSSSRKGVVRGVHFADVPPGQAKYVSCFAGKVLDFVVDVRVGSPTFGKWESVLLSPETRTSVFISEGLGHAFVSLSDESVVNYLVTETFSPKVERGINPLDPSLGLEFGIPSSELVLSEKDLNAPNLVDLESQELLPKFQSVNEFVKNMKVQL